MIWKFTRFGSPGTKTGKLLLISKSFSTSKLGKCKRWKQQRFLCDRGSPAWRVKLCNLSEPAQCLQEFQAMRTQIMKLETLNAKDQVLPLVVLNWAAPSSFTSQQQMTQSVLAGSLVNAEGAFGGILTHVFFHKKGPVVQSGGESEFLADRSKSQQWCKVCIAVCRPQWWPWEEDWHRGCNTCFSNVGLPKRCFLDLNFLCLHVWFFGDDTQKKQPATLVQPGRFLLPMNEESSQDVYNKWRAAPCWRNRLWKKRIWLCRVTFDHWRRCRGFFATQHTAGDICEPTRETSANWRWCREEAVAGIFAKLGTSHRFKVRRADCWFECPYRRHFESSGFGALAGNLRNVHLLPGVQWWRRQIGMDQPPFWKLVGRQLFVQHPELAQGGITATSWFTSRVGGSCSTAAPAQCPHLVQKCEVRRFIFTEDTFYFGSEVSRPPTLWLRVSTSLETARAEMPLDLPEEKGGGGAKNKRTLLDPATESGLNQPDKKQKTEPAAMKLEALNLFLSRCFDFLGPFGCIDKTRFFS